MPMQNPILTKGFRLLSSGDYLSAYILFKLASASSLQSEERVLALQGTGISLYFQQQYEAAISKLEESLIKLKDRLAYILIAQAYLILGDVKKECSAQRDYEVFSTQFSRILIKEEIVACYLHGLLSKCR